LNDLRKCAPRGWLGRLGPGLVAGSADDDPFGVATSSQAGAAPWRYGVLVFAILCGLAIDYAGFEPMRLLIWTALLNGVVAPPFLFVMMLVASNEEAMGPHASPRWLMVLGWAATAAMTLAVILLGIETLRQNGSV